MKQRFTLFLLLLCSAVAFGQYTNSIIYDFRDGTIIGVGQSPDGKLTLAGTYRHHGSQYGLNMKAEGEINIAVEGSSTIRFLGSKHSGLTMVGTAVETGDLGSQVTKVAQDLKDAFDFVYSGPATTLNFQLKTGSGNDLYLPTIELIPAQPGATATTAESNIIYYYDLRDGSIIPTTTDGKSGIQAGLLEVVVGPSNAYGYNGTQHGSILKGGNQLKLQVAGNAYIRLGGSIYSNGTITATSASGEFDVSAQAAKTSGNFGNDGSTVDFLYVGEAGTVTLDFSGTNYIPYIEVAPVPYEVTLTQWVQKSGTITLNGTDISLTTGAEAGSAASVTVSDGTVISATDQAASLLVNLGGKALAELTPTYSGDIDTVRASGDSLLLTFKDATTNPRGYVLLVKDNSTTVEAEAGKTYTYKFYDGSEMPQISYQQLRYQTFVTSDGILTINSNTDEQSLQFGYHDASHGGVFFPGNSFDIVVAGDAIITFIVDTYGSARDAVFELTDAEGTVLGSMAAQNIGGADGFPSSFAYRGPKGKLTAKLISASFPTAEIYLHGLNIENAATVDPSNGLTDVWDFGAEQLDAAVYNNQLDESTINAWYDSSITPGSSGKVLPNFSAGILSWIGGGNDRLRTTNTNLTRYDENISSAPGFTGRIYVNSAANSGRYLSLSLSEDDEVTIVAKTDAGGMINFEYVADPSAQTDQVSLTSALTELKFVAQEAGTYHIFDTQGKPSYYRIYRKDATYVELTGAVDIADAPGLPAEAAVVFTNEAGKTWTAPVAAGAYGVKIPASYSYNLSLAGANGYIISNGDEVTVADTTLTHDITIIKVDLYTVSGTISGLGEAIAGLQLSFTPDSAAARTFVPQPVVDAQAATYTVQLEPGVAYTIAAQGVNDYFIPANTITIAEATTADIAFSAKPRYPVVINAPGLTAEQLTQLNLTFTNLYEVGYSYHFPSVADISLRDGTYTLAHSGLDAYPLELGLTSNLTVAGVATSKTLNFRRVTDWSFDDRNIVLGDTTNKGLLFPQGGISNEQAKGHLVARPDALIQVPVLPGEKVTVTYYYSADFSIEGGDPITTNSQSTSTLENAAYVYTGTAPGLVSIRIGNSVSTTYITHIAIGRIVPYRPLITVGTDRDYATINDALDAVRNMVRGEDDRVTIAIDPGNYEEMLVIDEKNVTLKNAAAAPSIELRNKGVDIDDNAVRITSYYGHGYSYYSMGNDQKWDADVLRVNKENGYLSYANKGAGTTNASYWNATVVVFADGFEAEDIIFENSFNQYISKKETEDVVVMWATGSKGERPTDYGNTAVQQRIFVERAAALAIANNVQKVILDKCRVVGRQDSYFGGVGSRVVVYKGAMMGAVDYIFGGMTAVFYQTDLVMNTSDASNDAAYLTAAQQGGGRGYLMYECKVTTALPGTETASAYRSKPGYFGRPWQATTSEVVFYNTTIDTTDYPGYEGQSLILPLGWQNTLGGESRMMYEYGTQELSGEDNAAQRASWSTLLSMATLTDGTEITTFNFTKGNDGWDPLPRLIQQDETVGVQPVLPQSAVQVHAYADRIYISQVSAPTLVQVYSINGRLMSSRKTNHDIDFNYESGLWIVHVQAPDGIRTVKVVTTK